MAKCADALLHIISFGNVTHHMYYSFQIGTYQRKKMTSDLDMQVDAPGGGDMSRFMRDK